MTNWNETTLDEIALVTMGQSPPGDTCSGKKEGVPLLNGPTEFGDRFPSPVQFTTNPKRFSDVGDLLFCVRGSTTGRMNWADREYAIGRGLAAIRHKDGLELQPFLKGIIDLYLPSLLAVATGSTFPNVSKNDILGIKCFVPDKKEQKRIAHILGSLDDKIELNRKQNETLEAMARAIFQSWFVDFDPVIDNALAAGRPIPAELREKAARRKQQKNKHSLPKEIKNLFPDRFEPSPLGPIPKGWKIGKLGDIALNIRKPARLDKVDPESAYIGLEHMPQKCIALSEWGKAEEVASNKFEFTEGQILFGKLRPYFHKVGVAVMDGICSTDILVVEPKVENQFGVVLSYLSSDALIEYTTSHSSGTRMPRTNWTDLAKFPVVLVPDKIAQYFTAMITDYTGKLKTNIHESKTLAQLRDTLLPKLLTGEIEV